MLALNGILFDDKLKQISSITHYDRH